MSEAMTDMLSNLREHAPTMPSATDAREAVLSHLPSMKDLDTSSLTEQLSRPRRKGLIAAVLGVMASVAAIVAVLRHRRNQSVPSSPSMYTPPLPKP